MTAIDAPVAAGEDSRAARRADLVALLTVAIWGVSFTFNKRALDEIEVAAFMCVRYLGMVALAWAVLLVRRAAGRPIGIVRADLPRLALAGILGYSIFIVLSTVGLARTTAFSTALLVGTAPLFAALLLWMLRLETIARRQVGGMLVAFAGVLVFLADKMLARLSDAGLGDLLCLTGALFFAAYSIASKPLGARYAVPVMIAHTSTIGSIPVILATLPAALAHDWTRVSAPAWASLAWTILVPVYFAWTLWGWVIARNGVVRASLFMFLVPVAGALASRLLYGETFHALKLGGAALILAGLAVARRAGAARRGEAPTPRASRDGVT
ncbi:MAG: DMT family transporter [Candidatus Rokubacteria bacterium]|nr:DMT family transporter [Candidatus Rokubacteria bacterium]